MTEIPAPSDPVREAADWLLDDHDTDETVTLLDPPLDVLWGLARAESDPRAAPSITATGVFPVVQAWWSSSESDHKCVTGESWIFVIDDDSLQRLTQEPR
jgi:hypothetical protein